MVVLHRGRRVVEQYWQPYAADDAQLVYSVSKTLTGTAIGLAVAEGRLRLSDRVVDLLPDAAPASTAPASTDPAVASITVHHLLSMSTGHDVDTIEAIVGAPEAEWAHRILAVPAAGPVGSRHVYNNGASWLLGEIIRRRTGSDLLDYLRPRVLEPLGIQASWDTDALGRCLGWTGAHLRPVDLAAIGELYRLDGVWQGHRLLPEGWVRRATTAQIATTPDDSEPEWGYGYGYQLWLSREGYRLDGAFGQYALVIPERELVIAITSAQSGNQVLLDLVADLLVDEVEALDAASGPVELALPVPLDAGLDGEWSVIGAWQAGSTRDFAEPDQHSLPALDGFRVRAEGGDVRIGFTAEGSAAALTASAGSWLRQSLLVGEVEVPVAVAAGTASDGSVDVRICFVETPHTLRVVVAADGTGFLSWKVSPLHAASLADLRA